MIVHFFSTFSRRIFFFVLPMALDMGTNSISLQPDGKGNFVGNGELDMGGKLAITCPASDARY